MRPCSSCGEPIANNLLTCDGCSTNLTALDSHEVETPREIGQSDFAENDEQRDVWWFLLSCFVFLVIGLPTVGYLLAGPVIAFVFGFLGVLIFGMLEQMTH